MRWKRALGDDYVLQLWAHFYVAAQNKGEVVNLKPSPTSLDKLKSDPIYTVLGDIFGRREKAEKLLPKIAELPCPQSPQ